MFISYRLLQRNRFPSSFEPAFVDALHRSKLQQRRIDKGKDSLEKAAPTNDDSFRRRRFTLMLPPPNVTGNLHLGHALTVAIEDTLVRYRRMIGEKGTDHAGIATQSLVEKALYKKHGLTKQSMGKEAFLNEIHTFVNEKFSCIYAQLDALAPTLNYDYQFFTLDKERSRAVQEAFYLLYKRGLIYRAQKMINWSPSLRTTISDIEVESREEEGKMYYVRYDLVDLDASSSSSVVVATTRPETIYGDVCLAFNSNDMERYESILTSMHLTNELSIDNHRIHASRRFMARNPLNRRRLLPLVVDDELVDSTLGTGVVKVTPMHDKNDYECAKRLKLRDLGVDLFDDGGRLCVEVGCDELGASKSSSSSSSLLGFSRDELRLHAIEALKSSGHLEKIEQKTININRCSRSGDVIEPKLKTQWFVDCSRMASDALRFVRTNRLRLHPPTPYTAIFINYMTQLEQNRALDWCISRQLVWGHRIPMYKVMRLRRRRRRTTTAAAAEEEEEAEELGWVCARNSIEAWLEFFSNGGKSNSVTNNDVGDSSADANKRRLLNEFNIQLHQLSDDNSIEYMEASRLDDLFSYRYRLEQDEDVLDTWFSSALLPLSVAGWPQRPQPSSSLYPLSLMETGHDILFFWVARMIFLCTSLHEEQMLPFEDVYLHPMIRDREGRKMSKSIGNVIDPLWIINGVDMDTILASARASNLSNEEIERATKNIVQEYNRDNGIRECGVDALRFSLLAMMEQKDNINLDLAKVYAVRRYLNKIYQAVRFYLKQRKQLEEEGDEAGEAGEGEKAMYSIIDDYIDGALSSFKHSMHQNLRSALSLAKATSEAQRFFVADVCDVYVERCKYVGNGGNLERRASLQRLEQCLIDYLLLCYPLHPSISSFLYEAIVTKDIDEMLLKTTTTTTTMTAAAFEYESQERLMGAKMQQILLSTLSCIRSLMAELGASSNYTIHLLTSNDGDDNNELHELHAMYKREQGLINHLCRTNDRISIIYHQNMHESTKSDILASRYKRFVEPTDGNVVVIGSKWEDDKETKLETSSKAIRVHEEDGVDCNRRLRKLRARLAAKVARRDNDAYQRLASVEVKAKHDEDIKKIENKIKEIEGGGQ